MKTFIRKEIFRTDRFELEVFQDLGRIEFSLSIDYSASPFLLCINLFMWSMEFSIYSNNHIKINKQYESTRNN